MIRGPVLPQQRETLWPLVAGRLDAIERGLVLVFEGLDCAGGQLGLVDGLARDAGGAPVLVLLAIDGDALLSARVLAAVEFLDRLGDSLANALPEAGLCPGSPGRVVVVGTDVLGATLERIRRLGLKGVQVCRLEPFRIAGTERFAVCWLADAHGGSADGLPEFCVPADQQPVWRLLQEVSSRIDPAVRVDGDRYLRRISWRGRTLGEIRLVDGCLVGADEDGASHALISVRHAHAFGDRLLRAFARQSGLAIEHAAMTDAERAPVRDPATRLAAGSRSGTPRGGESLRSTLAAAQLSPEEYSALGGLASAAGGEAEGAVTADDVVRIVAAQEGSWPAERSG